MIYIFRWIYAELRFLPYRIRTNVLRLPDRVYKVTPLCTILTDDMISNNKELSLEEMYINIDQGIRDLRDKYKNGKVIDNGIV